MLCKKRQIWPMILFAGKMIIFGFFGSKNQEQFTIPETMSIIYKVASPKELLELTRFDNLQIGRAGILEELGIKTNQNSNLALRASVLEKLRIANANSEQAMQLLDNYNSELGLKGSDKGLKDFERAKEEELKRKVRELEDIRHSIGECLKKLIRPDAEQVVELIKNKEREGAELLTKIKKEKLNLAVVMREIEEEKSIEEIETIAKKIRRLVAEIKHLRLMQIEVVKKTTIMIKRLECELIPKIIWPEKSIFIFIRPGRIRMSEIFGDKIENLIKEVQYEMKTVAQNGILEMEMEEYETRCNLIEKRLEEVKIMIEEKKREKRLL